MKSAPVTHAAVPAFRRALLDHYDRTSRDLPWRRDTDPYRVLVSEIMLQQTRVETVKGYYEPWLERFPTVSDLAAADGDDVLKAWEGLGYYRRALNLHNAARVVRDSHAGSVPGTYSALLGLPGVGAYTAGAIASIAFGETVPAVDGNVRRVLARLFDVAEPKPAWLRERAAELVPHDRPGDWNQSLMELGATVCTPRSPDCDGCPVRAWCAAHARGTVDSRPAPTRKRAVPTAAIAVAVIHHDGRVALGKRGQCGLLAGLWAFPEAPIDGGIGDGEGGIGAEGIGDPAVTAAVSLALELGAQPIDPAVRLPEVVHRFSHFKARYHPVSIAVACDESSGEWALDQGLRWVEPSIAASELALPVAQQKILDSWPG